MMVPMLHTERKHYAGRMLHRVYDALLACCGGGASMCVRMRRMMCTTH